MLHFVKKRVKRHQQQQLQRRRRRQQEQQQQRAAAAPSMLSAETPQVSAAPLVSPTSALSDAGARRRQQGREHPTQGTSRVDVSSRQAASKFIGTRDFTASGGTVTADKVVWRKVVDKNDKTVFRLRSSLTMAVTYQEREWGEVSQGRCLASPEEKARAEETLASDDQRILQPAGHDPNRRIHFLYDNVGTLLCKVKTSRRHAIRLQSEIYHRADQERQLRQRVRVSQHLPPPPVVGNRVWEPVIGSDVELLLPKALAGGAVKDIWYRVRVCELDSDGKIVFGFLVSQAKTEKITKFSSVYDYDEVVRKKGYVVRPGTHLTWKVMPTSAAP
ncbi:unnamed protein product [Ectocarpus sp. 8 AP-2014]